MADKQTGTRERKRAETQRRVSDAALKLFLAQGYEETTVDAIANAAGISRRTFFHYFASKDDIIIATQGSLGQHLIDALASVPDAQNPMATLRAAMVGIAASYSIEDLTSIDRLMISSETVQARKQANYIRDEARLSEALVARWPDRDASELRLCAMVAMGISRLSLEIWRAEGGTRHIVDVVEHAFAALERDLTSRPSPHD